MTWTTQTEAFNSGRGQRFVVSCNGRVLSFADALSGWENDTGFRAYFAQLLADTPFDAFRWETPPVTAKTVARDFEFVLLRCDSLDRPANQTPFESHFTADFDVVTFPNLSGDAVLVVPCPTALSSTYGHLASFSRNAPEAQQHQLWRSVAVAMTHRISSRPVWLSTAGMGVSWLHVRLDNHPKYYGYARYREGS